MLDTTVGSMILFVYMLNWYDDDQQEQSVG